MREEVMETIVMIFLAITFIVALIIIGAFSYVDGKGDIIQDLCTRHQYDFCEVVEHKTEYILKKDF